MFRALICSSSGGTAYTAIGIVCAYYVGWLLGAQNIPTVVYTVPPDDEKIGARNMYRLLLVID
jgi:hypothetical protein